jgi:1-deoxyxylulose-5-phosphate synthase
VVIAAKVFYPVRKGSNGGGLSRKAIMMEIDNSLRRLGTDYVDLYQSHCWDYGTPIEETLEALSEVVRAGKVRYIGASSMYAWQFAKALYTADLNGWTRFATMQDHYSLLNREEEREMLPLCEAEGIGVASLEPTHAGAPDARLGGEQHSLRDRLGRHGPICRARRLPIARSSRGSPRSRQSMAFLAPRSPSPGWCRSRSSPPRSSAHRNLVIWTMPSPLCPCSSRLKRSRRCRSFMYRTRLWASRSGCFLTQCFSAATSVIPVCRPSLRA